MEETHIIRKSNVDNELEKLKLSYRYDSKLCSCYVQGTTGPEWTAERVAKECAIMYWLYNHTPYEAICNNADIQETHKYIFYNEKQLKDHMRRYIYPKIKEFVIKDNGGIPESWPWL